MSKRIVIAADAWERTRDPLALGRLLAATTGVRATLVSIFPYVSLGDRDDAELVRVGNDARRILSELAAETGLADADTEVIPGDVAARELQRITERPDTGLIVVGSTTRGPVGRLLIGGVGERLLAGAACPVAIAPRGYTDAPSATLARIGVGVDSSDEAQRALEAAVALAQKTDAEIRVITTYQQLAFGGATLAALPSTSANEEMRRQLRAVHDAALAATRGHATVTSRFEDGSADQVLLDESADLDLLVVGSRGYGPLGAVLMGSVSAALAHGAACPVLVTPRGTRFDLLD
jgi:nucleotide-binding universal stress UspA family protein